MSWTRALLPALVLCALLTALLAGATGCGSGDGRGDGEARPTPAGKVLEDTDEEGRHYREVDEGSAPEVAIEIQPDTGTGDGWNVRLTVRDFRFSPAGTERRAEPGRGYALLRLDGRPLALLRGRTHHLAGDVVPHGTHQVTVRLHADDDTVWAVDGEPIARTADITVSGPDPTRGRLPRTRAGLPLEAAASAAASSAAASSSAAVSATGGPRP